MSEKTYEQRINNIIGQLNGVSKMINEKKDCESILIQTKSIKSAISSIMDKIIEEELGKCIANKSINKDDLKKIIKYTNN